MNLAKTKAIKGCKKFFKNVNKKIYLKSLMILKSDKDMPREIRTAGTAMYDVNVNIKVN